MLEFFNVISLKIKYGQVLQKTDVKQLLDFVVPYVKLLELFECLNALDFLELTAPDVKHADVCKRSSEISE